MRDSLSRFTGLVFFSIEDLAFERDGYRFKTTVEEDELEHVEVRGFGDVCPTLEACYWCEIPIIIDELAVAKMSTSRFARLEEDRRDVGAV